MSDDVQETQTTKPTRPRGPKNEPLPPVVEQLREAEAGLDEGEPSAVIEPAPGELEATLTDLGKAVEREAGDYDLSEEAHLSAIERAEQAASDWEVNCSSLVWDARDFLLEQIKRRPRPWSGSSPTEQRDIAAACEHAGRELVRKVAEALASGGQPSARVLLGQITLGDDIKISGKVKVMGEESEDQVVLFLHRAHGQHVMLTLASKDAHQQGERPAPGVPLEEPELEFEAGAHEIPDDDSDLREAGGDEPGPHEPVVAIISTGDVIDVGDAQDCEARVNLKTGMVEAKHPMRDEFDIDVRPATSAELAAERERTADFVEA